MRLLLVFLLLFCQGCYLINQTYHQADLLWRREEIDSVLTKEDSDAKTKERLTFVKSLLKFAQENGLKTESAYQYYVDVGRDHLSYAVSAAYFDRLESITWRFPIVGKVPYLGFFSKKDRDSEAKDLRDAGYDVSTFGVNAFSSLGWFSDPIYSTMLRDSKEDLADTIFHELCHRNFWLEDQAEFNESIASYVGFSLSEKFLHKNKQDDLIKRIKSTEVDHQLFLVWLKSLKNELTELYASDLKNNAEALRAKKAGIFASFMQEKKPAFKLVDYVGRREWNNATVLGASMYEPDIERFAKAYTCFEEQTHKNIGSFLPELARLTEGKKEPYGVLDSFCQGSEQDGKKAG